MRNTWDKTVCKCTFSIEILHAFFFSRFSQSFMVYSLLDNSSDFHVISHFELLRSQSWFVLGVSLWLQGLWAIKEISAISSSKVKNNDSLTWWDDYRYALYGSATVLVLSVGQGVWSLVDFNNFPTWTTYHYEIASKIMKPPTWTTYHHEITSKIMKPQ